MTVPELAKAQAVHVLSKPGLTIAEYFGTASTGDGKLSACLATVTSPCDEAHQTPEHDQYIMVVSGRLRVARGGQTLSLAQGDSVRLQAGQRVLWMWPGPCQYVIICLPGLAAAEGPSIGRAGISPRHGRLEQHSAPMSKRCRSPIAARAAPAPLPARMPEVQALLASPFSVATRDTMETQFLVPVGEARADFVLGLKSGVPHSSTRSMDPTEDPNPAGSEATTDSTEGAGNLLVNCRNIPDCLPGCAEMSRMSPFLAFEQAIEADLLVERSRADAVVEAEERPARYGARHLSTPLVIVASELNPWSKTGGLAMVTSAYAYEFAVRGHRTMVVSPRYGEYDRVKYVGHAKVWLDGQHHEVRYFHQRQEFGAGKGCDYVFVDHDRFRRPGIYCDPFGGGEYEDNLFRFALLSVAAAEAPLVLELNGSIYGQEVCFIANDWQSGLLPLYLLYKYKRNRTYRKARCIMVIHNLGYQGRFRKSRYPVDRFLGLPPEAANELQGEDAHMGKDTINLLAAGIKLADRVLTVSPNYAKEIQTVEGGFGLHLILHEKASSMRLVGILNGIFDEWSPLKDPYIARRYGPSDFEEGKRACKAALQRELGLQQDPNVALLGFCGRLCYQKGVHLITAIIPWLMQDQGSGVTGKIQVVLMGKGESHYERQLRGTEALYPGRVCGYVGFDPTIEHRMMAGCDLLLMPSQYEPCGLPQMYAQQYGTIPVAHQTGGLKDSIQDLADEVRDCHRATGFLFTGWDSNRLMGRVYEALDAFFNNRRLFLQMQANALQCCYYWPKAIDEYEKHIDFTMEDLSCRI